MTNISAGVVIATDQVERALLIRFGVADFGQREVVLIHALQHVTKSGPP